MKAKVLGVIAGATMIVVAGIVIATNVMSTASSAEENQAAADNMTNNDVSNDALGRLIMVVEFKTTSINPVNQTYIEVSTASNVTIIPPNATGGKTIRATETANATLNILPNGLGVTKGQSLIVTEEIENVTSTFVGIIRVTPDGPAGGTDVVTFHTESTGQLAFLDNFTGIMQSEFSPGGGRIRTWEWNGGALPFPTDGGTQPLQP